MDARTHTFTVGKIVNTHGIKGEVRVISHTDFPEERFAKGSKLLLVHPSHTQPVPLQISESRTHKNFYILQFKDHSSINDVEKYKGSLLKITEAELLDLDADEYYIHQIVGCEVFTEEGERIGTIKEVLRPGANDVWVVQRDKLKDLLLPYIDEVVKQVDVDQKKVTVHLMEGLE